MTDTGNYINTLKSIFLLTPLWKKNLKNDTIAIIKEKGFIINTVALLTIRVSSFSSRERTKLKQVVDDFSEHYGSITGMIGWIWMLKLPHVLYLLW